MNLAALSEFDFSNVGGWPWPLQAATVAVAGAAVLALGVFYDTSDQLAALEQVRNTETELRQTLTVKQGKAVNLEAYKQQSQEMKVSFGAMVRQLPNRTEVAELLVDVSQTGLANGLEFELFQPTEEIPQEFYAELPIKLRVIGRFHEFGSFVSGLAALPRIVTLHDIQIAHQSKQRGADEEADPSLLVMDATAKTYRYLDDEEESAQHKEPSRGGKKK